MGILIVIGIIVLLILMIVGVYNAIIMLENRVQNAWGQIEVQLKKRHDLVPNLVETVKGYMTHERDTLERVIQARNASVHAGSVPEAVASENMLTGALRQLFALSEAYPDLKANQNFLQLQNDLTGIENKIAYTRQAYNDAVLQYNNKVETFPGVVVAGLMGKTEKAMFEIEDATQREVPRVSFS